MRYLIVLLSCLVATASFAEPRYFKVVNVASDDTLNVRAEPNASSADIGDLPYNAVRIEVAGTDASGKWGRIVWQEGNGWIATRFLAPDPIQMIGNTGLPAGLVCAGTEPFWTMNFSDSSGAFSDASGNFLAVTLQGARTAEGRSSFPVQLGAAGNGANVTALIKPLNCSDGMSDRTYPWSVDLIMRGNSGGRYLVGCCQLPLDYGFN